MKLKCSECNWSGDISKCRRNSDRGWIGGVWWWVAWFCPKCEKKIEEAVMYGATLAKNGFGEEDMIDFAMQFTDDSSKHVRSMLNDFKKEKK